MGRRSALITGAASGIGAAVAEELAKRGYDLTLLDLDGASLAATADGIKARHGASVLVSALDVCDEEAQAEAFKRHVATFGGMDFAFLNAGIGEREDFLLADPGGRSHLRTLDVDLAAAVSGVRLAAHCMMTSGASMAPGGGGRGGCVVAVASAAGVFPVPAGPVYAAAKGGLVHFIRSVAPRLAARGVTAAAVCPQYVDTPLVSNMLRYQPETAKAMMGPLWGMPLLTPAQVVGVVTGVIDKHEAETAAGRRWLHGGGGGGGGVAGDRQAEEEEEAVRRRLLAGGAGCVHLLLQNGQVVDPFMPKRRTPAKEQQQQQQGQGQGQGQPSGGGCAAAVALARFSDDSLRRYAQQKLPSSYRKLQVVQLSTDFRAATRIVEAPLPRRLPAGAVLVRRLFAGVNASDINYTSGRYHGTPSAAQHALPYDAGFESVGVVVAVADDVKGLPPGTPVGTMDGGFSEYGLHAAARALKVPAPTPEVLSLLTSGLTASIALEQAGGLPLPPPFAGSPASPRRRRAGAGGAGSRPTALVTAAAGGTGQFAVQLARLAGCRVVATCGGEDKERLLRDLGADRVINYRREDVKSVLKSEFPNGLDLVYESVGGKMFDVCVDALADRGVLIVIGMMSAYSDGWKRSAHEGLAEKLLWKSARVEGFFLLRHAPLWGPHLSALVELVRRGELRAAIDPQQFAGLGAVAGAVDRLQSGASSGKVVVQVAQELPPAAPGGGARL